jgi:hypothetical protein
MPINQHLNDNITQYGLQVQHILEDDEGPGFSYSVGLFKNYSHPEIIIVGLKQQLAHTLINDMAHNVREGKVFTALTFDPDILEDFECYIIQVDKSNYDNYVGQAQNYYGGDNFPLIQCIYPTANGIYPWEAEWPEEIKDLQPILGSIK